jgi:hypothetical protein
VIKLSQIENKFNSTNNKFKYGEITMNDEISQEVREHHISKASNLIKDIDFDYLYQNAANKHHKSEIKLAYFTLLTSQWILKRCTEKEEFYLQVKLINYINEQFRDEYELDIKFLNDTDKNLLINITNRISTQQTEASSSYYMIKFVMSVCTDITKVNLREASYKLDYQNKKLILDLVRGLLMGEDEYWDELKTLDWVEMYHPKIFSEGMNDV